MIHTLYCKNIYNKLVNNGCIYPAVLHSKKHPEGVFHLVIDFAACNAEKWKAERRKILTVGVIDFNRRDADGFYGARRDYTETEQEELALYPVQFSEDGNCMRWQDTQDYNPRPAIYASYALPDTVLTLETDDNTYRIKNGELIVDEEDGGVVHCKDCKYYAGVNTLRCDHPQLRWDVECYDQWLEMEPDGFCSHGELKNN